MTYRIGFIGTGASPDDPDTDGFAMAYRHAAAYERLADCELVACADIVRSNAEAFAAEHDIEHVYEDYERMLTAAAPDIVSVCVPPHAHADIVRGCAAHGGPEAVHCEKPMATAWRDCREMGQACDEAGIKLTINHQYRMGTVYRTAKERLDSGAIGELRRIEWSAKNLFDFGTHMFDLAAFYTDQCEVEWILAGLDYRERNVQFGAHNENQAVAQWRYANGVTGTAMTGAGAGSDAPRIRLFGTDGTIEVGAPDGPPLRERHDGTRGWKTLDVGENVWGDRTYTTYPGYVRWGVEAAGERLAPLLPGVSVERFRTPSFLSRAVADVVRAVREDSESELTWHNAIQSTELIFAAWESVRKRGRVDLPLTVDDNPLSSMVDDGQLVVSSGE